MFSALIRWNFLPWSIHSLKEKSGKEILAEFNSFPSHVVNKDTGLEDPSFSKCGHAGRHSSKEILRIGMFRTPFSCGYYQYTENVHLARTKLILSCLFLLEAHGLELYYRPIRIKYHGNMHITWHICWPNALANEETLLGTDIIPSLPSIANIVVILLAGSSWTHTCRMNVD